jgi:trimeric autotransporter adhesin
LIKNPSFIGANFSAGAASAILASVVFSNSNGVSFGLNGSTITASVAAGGGGGTGISGIADSANTQTVGTLSFANSNGISFGLSTGANTATLTASYSVPTVTNSSWTVSDHNTSATVGRLAFTQSNGLTLSLSTSNNGQHTIIGSYTVPSTAGLISGLNVSGGAGNSQSAVSGLTFNNSNGMTFGVSTGASVVTVTASYTVPTVTNSSMTVSDAATSGTLARLAFTNLNGVTLSLSTGGGGSHTIVGSVVTTYLTSQSNQAFSAGGGSSAFQTLSFANSFGVSFSNSGGSVAGSIATTYAGTGITMGSTTGAQTGTQNTAGLSLVVPTLTRFIAPVGKQLTQVTAPGNASQTVVYCFAPLPVTATRLDILMQISAGSSATTNTCAVAFSQYAIIYTKNVSTLSSLSSGSTQTTYTFASNTAGATYLSQGAIYPISVPINVNMAPGEYFVGVNFVTATSSIGLSTTNNGFTYSILGANDIQTASNYAEFAATATSTNLWGGMGIYSAATTGVVTRLSLNAVNQTGSALSAANIALVFRNA